MRLLFAVFLIQLPFFSFARPVLAKAKHQAVDAFLESQGDEEDWKLEEWQKYAIANIDRIMKKIDDAEKAIDNDETLTKGINKEIKKQEKELEELELNIDEATSEINKFDVTSDEATSDAVKAFADEQKTQWDGKLEKLRGQYEKLKESIQTSQTKEKNIQKQIQISSNRLGQYLMLAQLAKLQNIAVNGVDRKIASTDAEQVLKIVADVRKSRQKTRDSIDKIKTSMQTGP